MDFDRVRMWVNWSEISRILESSAAVSTVEFIFFVVNVVITRVFNFLIFRSTIGFPSSYGFRSFLDFRGFQIYPYKSFFWNLGLPNLPLHAAV